MLARRDGVERGVGVGWGSCGVVRSLEVGRGGGWVDGVGRRRFMEGEMRGASGGDGERGKGGGRSVSLCVLFVVVRLLKRERSFFGVGCWVFHFSSFLEARRSSRRVRLVCCTFDRTHGSIRRDEKLFLAHNHMTVIFSRRPSPKGLAS